jgi:ABC-type uncharacterized transport system ATPase component
MLELKELYKTFNPGTINAKTALNGLSLTLNDGDFVTVIGGNGAGKSTMLNATAGTFFVDSGKVIIDGSDVTNLPEHKRAAFIGRVFQDPMMGTAPSMWIEENLALAAFLIGWGGISVHCQTAAVIAGTDIKSARHTVGRLLHGAISALCMWVLANLL